MNDKWADAPVPAVSIVMAAYNGEGTIGRALDSIIEQTFTDWELIVIDDGSTDATANVVQGYAARDPRIRLFRNESNLELSASLNKGIGLARADLIARADDDDINLPQRLERQVAYMQEHNETDVLGTAAYLLDETGQRVSVFMHPTTHAELKNLPFLKIQFFHPSVMIRRSFFDKVGLYDPGYPNAEDKELWLRGLSAGCHYANLPEPLIEYSTGGYVKSWRSLLTHARSLLRIARKQEIENGYRQTFTLFARMAAVNLRIYTPKSLRGA